MVKSGCEVSHGTLKSMNECINSTEFLHADVN